MNTKDDESGFIPTDVQRKGLRRAIYIMRIAPEAGYQKELTLGPEFFEKHLKTSGESHNTQYFYFKLQDRYGKGYIHVPELRIRKNRETVVKAVVIFQLQPDGSRNLETEN